MKKFFSNLTLFIVAVILYYIIMPIAFSYITIKFLFLDRTKIIGIYSEMLFSHAQSIDQTGNGAFYVFFNDIFIKDDTLHPFGNNDETISSVLGVNKLKNNLTIVGKILDGILSLIDENHTIKSINS
jgi:hypothetical protein